MDSEYLCNTMSDNPTNEERTMAALAHASIIGNPINLLGLICSALIWATQRQRSAYVAHHALQALLFQGIGLLLLLLLVLVWGGCLLVSLLPAILRPALYRTDLPISFWLALLSGLVPLFVTVVWVGYGLAGAWAAWNGNMFTYMPVDRLYSLKPREDDSPPDNAPAMGQSADEENLPATEEDPAQQNHPSQQ